MRLSPVSWPPAASGIFLQLLYPVSYTHLGNVGTAQGLSLIHI
ncbi:hypothetical protein [Erwinia amylovora]